MKLTKEEVQQRVLKDGKPLDLKLFDWDIKTRTFKSSINGLIIDFTDIDNVNFNTADECSFTTGSKCTFDTGAECVFNTGSNCMFLTTILCEFKTDSNCVFNTRHGCIFNTPDDCTFNTGDDCAFVTGSDCVFVTRDKCIFKTKSNCTFNTRDDCTFDTKYDCTFNTRNNCTFDTGPECAFKTGNGCVFNTGSECKFVTGPDCLIRNRSNNEVIIPKSSIKITTCPLLIPGYLIGSDYYVNDVKQEGEYMIADGILSKIISKKGKVFKVYICTKYTDGFTTKPTYIVQVGDFFAHGETIEEANKSLIYKISNRDASVYDNLTIDSVLTKEEAIKMYRVITGSCEYGVRNFVESLPEVKDKYSIQEIVELTTGQYGNDVLRNFFKI